MGAPQDKPIIIVRESKQDLDEVVWQAAKAGKNNAVAELAGSSLLDTIPDATHQELGPVSPRRRHTGRVEIAVKYGHVERALTAAILLERAGHRDIVTLIGGPWDWSADEGSPLEARL